MKYLIILLALLFGGILMPPNVPAAAADLGLARSATYAQKNALPFPRSTRAAAVWGEGACWHDCQADCTWNLPACLSVDNQGRCLKYTDACDRSCQRACRARAGPYAIFGD